MRRDPLLDRIRGCLIGGAVGDALGWPVEFKSESEIFNQYRPNGIRAYDLNAQGVAEITDDTQMALFTANGLLCAETANRRDGRAKPPRGHVAAAYQDWLYTQEADFGPDAAIRPSGVSWLNDVEGLRHRRAPGVTCLKALRLQNAAPGNTEDYVKARLNESKGCGGIMRVAPMGLMDWPDIRALDYEGAQLAAITHGHSLGYMPAAVLVHIIHRIVYPRQPEAALKEIVVEARDTVSELFACDPFLSELRRVIDLAIDLAEHSPDGDPDNIHRLGEGWVAEETLGISLYCALKYRRDFSAGVIASVNHRGDSDSTGAVTGNILGALLGYEAIEPRWTERLELRDVILEMADDLYACQRAAESGGLETPDWTRKYARGRWKE